MGASREKERLRSERVSSVRIAALPRSRQVKVDGKEPEKFWADAEPMPTSTEFAGPGERTDGLHTLYMFDLPHAEPVAESATSSASFPVLHDQIGSNLARGGDDRVAVAAASSSSVDGVLAAEIHENPSITWTTESGE